MNHFVSILFCLSLLSLPAGAQERELKSGLNYTTMGAKPAAPTANPAQEAAAGEKPAATKDSPAAQVWNTYKELATGQTPEQKEMEKQSKKKPGTALPKAPEKPTTPKPGKPSLNGEAQEKPESAIGSIIRDWKNNKDSQREMRSKSFGAPAAPAAKNGSES